MLWPELIGSVVKDILAFYNTNYEGNRPNFEWYSTWHRVVDFTSACEVFGALGSKMKFWTGYAGADGYNCLTWGIQSSAMGDKQTSFECRVPGPLLLWDEDGLEGPKLWILMTQIVLLLAARTVSVCSCVLGEVAALPCCAEQMAWAVTIILTYISAHSLAMFAYTRSCFSSRSNVTAKSADWNCNYMLI